MNTKCPNCGRRMCDCRDSEKAMAAGMTRARQQIADHVPIQAEQLLTDDLAVWLEFEALSAISHLRRYDEQHWLVQAVELYKRSIAPDEKGDKQ